MKFTGNTESVVLSIEKQALIEVLIERIAKTTDEQELKDVWYCVLHLKIYLCIV